MNQQDPPPAALDSVRSRRRQIGDAVAELEQALAAPTGIGQAWGRRVMAAMRELGELGQEQRQTVIGPGGLVDDLRARGPRMVRKAEALQASLDDALGHLDGLLGLVEEADPVDVRDQVMPFLGEVSRLRQAMADLMWDAYWIDVGGPG